MYKHLSISPLIKVVRFAVLIAILILIVDSQHVSAQQQLAQDAYAIFEGSCLICHGSDGAYRETLLIDRPSLIANQTVIPGNPDSSEFYKRLLGPTDPRRTDAVGTTAAVRGGDRYDSTLDTSWGTRLDVDHCTASTFRSTERNSESYRCPRQYNLAV